MVTDFGIAKALTASRRAGRSGELRANTSGTLTSVGTSLGTPAYMAPEQAVGSAVDSRADLYAWGVMAYELLTGAHPFAGRATAQQLVAAHIAETPAPIGSRLPAIPAPLVEAGHALPREGSGAATRVGRRAAHRARRGGDA